MHVCMYVYMYVCLYVYLHIDLPGPENMQISLEFVNNASVITVTWDVSPMHNYNYELRIININTYM